VADNFSNLEDKKEKTYLRVLIPLFLIFITYLSHNILIFARFNFDDYPLIIENPYLRSWDGLLPLLKTGRPMRALSFWLDYRIWGLDARGFHFTNLLFHIACVVLVYYLLRAIFKERRIALISAILFSVHPANTEAIAGVAHRKELLCLLFLLLSYLCFLKEKKRYLWLGLSIIFYLCALLSKQVALSLPFLILLSAIILEKPYPVLNNPLGKKRIAGELFPYFAIPAVAFLFSFSDFKLFARFQSADFASYKHLQILATQLSCFPTYLRLVFFPAHLKLDYYVPEVENFLEPKLIIGVLSFLTSLALLFWLVKRKSPFGFAWGWFIFNLLPVMNWVPANFYIAERYLYIPLVGICLLITLSLERAGRVLSLYLERRWILLGLLFLANFLLIFFVFSSHIFLFKDEIWFGIKPISPWSDNSAVVAGLISALLVSGILLVYLFFSTKAKIAWFWDMFLCVFLIVLGYTLSVALVNRLDYGFWALPRPDLEFLYQRYHNWLIEQGAKDSVHFTYTFPTSTNFALYTYVILFTFLSQGLLLFLYNRYGVRLARLTPRAFLSWVLFCALFWMMSTQSYLRIQDWGWEVNLWRATVRENPHSFLGFNNLGRTYVNQGKYSEAINCFIIAHSLEPFRIEPMVNLGNTMLKLGKIEEAEHYFRWVLKNNPYVFPARINLGNILLSKKNYNLAIGQYLEALRIKPDSFEATYNLAVCFFELGDLGRTYLYLQRTLSIAPNHEPAKLLLKKLNQLQPSRQ